DDGDEVNGDPPTSPALVDTEGDSVGDNDEKTRGTNPAEVDTDGDSLDDGFEILLGSNPTDIDSPVEGGGTVVVFQSGFEYANGFPDVGLDARNLNGADDQIGAFSGELPEADVSGGLGDMQTVSPKDIAGDQFILVDRPLEPHVLSAEFASPIPVVGSIVSFHYATRRTGSHSKDVPIVGIDEDGNEVFHLIVSAKSDPPDGERLGFLGPDEGGEPEPVFDFEVVSGEDGHGDFNNVGANPGVNGVSEVRLFLLAQGFVVDYRKPGRGYRTEILPYRNDPSTFSKIEIRSNGGATGVSSGFFFDDLVVETAGKASDPNVIASPRVNLGQLPVTPGQEASVRLLNTGESLPLEISNVSVSGPDAANFTVAGFPASIEPGGEGEIQLAFDAMLRSGLFQAVIEVETNDPDLPLTKIEVLVGGVDVAGPIAHFPLDEAEGSTELQGISSNGLSGTLETDGGTATLGAEGLATGTALQVGGAGALRVQAEEIAAPEAFSVSMWVNIDAVGAVPQTLFAKGEPPTPNLALITTGGNVAWFIDGDIGIASSTGDAIQPGQTHHVVATYGEEVATIVVDGVEVVRAEDSDPLQLDRLTPWFFGGFGTITLDGRIDDVQFYDRGLTLEEATTLRDSPGVPLSSSQPVDPGPVGSIEGFAISRNDDGQVVLNWLALQDVGYRVEYSTSLEAADWAAVEDVSFTVNVNTASFVETNADRGGILKGFYRVVLLP
ncbi:MAG: LamG-like jellyroll fold domain-containing protein, partial [Verrucomicrobiota bacterium]